MKFHHTCLPLQIAPTDQCYKVSKIWKILRFQMERMRALIAFEYRPKKKKKQQLNGQMAIQCNSLKMCPIVAVIAKE